MFSLSELVSKYKPELPPSLPRWYPPQRPPPVPSHLLPFVSPRLQEPVARETMPLISRPLELQSIRIGVRVPSLFAKFLFHRFFCVFLTDLILNSLLPPEPPASDLINARCVCMHFVMCYGDKNGDSNCLLLFIHFYLFFLQVLPLFWLRWTPSQNGNRLQPILFVVRFIYQRASTFRSFTYWSRLKQNVVFFVNYNSIFFNGMVGAFNERPNHRTHCNCMRYIHGR